MIIEKNAEKIQHNREFWEPMDPLVDIPYLYLLWKNVT